MTDLNSLAPQPDPFLTELASRPITDPLVARAMRRVTLEAATPDRDPLDEHEPRHLTGRDVEALGRLVDLVREKWGENADEAWAGIPRLVDDYRGTSTRAPQPPEHPTQAP